MNTSQQTLFTPIYSLDKLHPSFRQMLDPEVSVPARWMMERVFADFSDADGNFVEQFQTTGFDARFFELYLYAYFSRSGFGVEQPGSPDFLVKKDGLTVAVEASTTNPSQAGPMATERKPLGEMDAGELQQYISDEYPIRLGSVLHSKLRKRYWEFDRCRDMPLVFAIAPFHEESAWGMTDSALVRYLFGIEQSASFTSDAKLDIATSPVDKHAHRTKEIPSSFFTLEETENISAVVFTNAATHGKFTRMGYQHGVGNDRLCISRAGFCADPAPHAMDPAFFWYDMDDPPFVETWGQGLSVFHNPNCRVPIPTDFFCDAANHVFRGGQLETTYLSRHPRSSTTYTLDLHDTKDQLRQLPLRMNTVCVTAIHRDDFEEITRAERSRSGFVQEIGWYADHTESFYGAVFRDRTDSDFGYTILARDDYFQFRCIHIECKSDTREEAVRSLQLKMAEFLRSPKRLFERPRDD